MAFFLFVCFSFVSFLFLRGTLGFMPPTCGGKVPALSRRLMLQTSVEKEIMRFPKRILKTNTDIRLEKITTENDVLNGADLCIQVFFVDDDQGKNKNSISNMIRAMNMKKLLRKHSFDLLNRFVHRPKDDCMVKAVQTNTGEMIGYAEIFVCQLDSGTYRSYVERTPAQQQLLDVDGKIYMPKIANLAVVKSARQQGIGKQLVRACLQQAKAWGFEQVVLTVDVDNKEGRSFYKRLGFEEMITDMSEKRYDICAGPWLTTVRAPKVWLRKVISDRDLVPSEADAEEVCIVDEIEGTTVGDGCDDGLVGVL